MKLHQWCIVLLLGLMLTSCLQSYALNKDEKTQYYSHDIALTQDELNEKLIDYINNTFISPQNVITTIQDDYIAARGSERVVENFLAGGMVLTNIDLQYSATFQMHDGEYKLKLSVVDFVVIQDGVRNRTDKCPITPEELRNVFDNMDADIFVYVTDVGW